MLLSQQLPLDYFDQSLAAMHRALKSKNMHFSGIILLSQQFPFSGVLNVLIK